MTRKQAMEIIKKYDALNCGYCHQGGEEIEEAFNMAIQALEHETMPIDGDCISRKAVLSLLADHFDNVFDMVRELPPVAIPSAEPREDAINHDFQIGDEVRIIGSDPIYDDCDVGWVIRNASEKVKTMYVMRNDGSADEENKAEWYKTGRHNYMLAEVIKALPSVTPQPKTGHWIMPVNDDGMSDSIYYQVRCSKCGFDLDPQTWHQELHQYGADKHCPNCGTKMVEEQESEEV